MDSHFCRANSMLYKITSLVVDGLVTKYFVDKYILNVQCLTERSQTDKECFILSVPNLKEFYIDLP